jgi:hypothetical protein
VEEAPVEEVVEEVKVKEEDK